jgi:hypothetical protein
MRSGLFLPLFDELANPVLVAKLAAAAEEAGWHGVFVWDHVRWREPVVDMADPWITLTAIAIASRPYGLAGAGRSKSPGKPRHWIGSAVAGSHSGSAWATTMPDASSRSPAKKPTTGGASACWTSPCKS